MSRSSAFLRREDHGRAAIALALAELPEAVASVVAQTAKGFALVFHARLRREQIALAAGQQITRGKAVDQARKRGTFLHGVVGRLAEDIQVRPIQSGEVVPFIGAPVGEQVIEPFIGEAADLREPPMGVLEQETAGLHREQRDLAALETRPSVVVDRDALDRHEVALADVFAQAIGEPAAVEIVRIGDAVAVEVIHVPDHGEPGFAAHADPKLVAAAAAKVE